MKDKPPEVFDFDHIQRLLSELRQYNRLDLRTAKFLKDGVPIEVSKELLDEWESFGVNNVDLVDFWDDLRSRFS